MRTREPRSPTRDSVTILRAYITEATRKRHKVKQAAVMSSRSDVVFVPAPTAPAVCPCLTCRRIVEGLTDSMKSFKQIGEPNGTQNQSNVEKVLPRDHPQ